MLQFKRYLYLGAIFAALSIFVFSPIAMATPTAYEDAFLWVNPVEAGDTVGMNVYLHAKKDLLMPSWQMNIGYDATELSPDASVKYTHSSGKDPWNITYGDTVLTTLPQNNTMQFNDSSKYGEELTKKTVTSIGGLQEMVMGPDGFGWNVPQSLSNGEDFLLFSIRSPYFGGESDGQEDIWIDRLAGGGGYIDFGMSLMDPKFNRVQLWPQFVDDNIFSTQFMEIYTDNTCTTLLGNNGPDFGASAPVPEPATITLFGLGLIGLAAVSRKKRQ